VEICSKEEIIYRRLRYCSYAMQEGTTYEINNTWHMARLFVISLVGFRFADGLGDITLP